MQPEKKKYIRAGFEEREDQIMGDKNNANNNPFTGRTIAATGKLEHFTRDGINSRIISLGATASNSVTRKTDYPVKIRKRHKTHRSFVTSD